MEESSGIRLRDMPITEGDWVTILVQYHDYDSVLGVVMERLDDVLFVNTEFGPFGCLVSCVTHQHTKEENLLFDILYGHLQCPMSK